MTGNLRRIIALLLLAGGAVGVALWWQSDRQQIGRQIRQIRKLVAKRPGEHPLTGLNKARRISEIFASEFETHAPQYDVVTRDRRTLIGAIDRFRSRSEVVSMQISERELWIDSEARRATLRMVVTFNTGVGALADREAYLVEMNLLEEDDGVWRIDFVDLLEVLEGPRTPW